MPLGGWFLLSQNRTSIVYLGPVCLGPRRPSQRIEFVLSASPETIRREPREHVAPPWMFRNVETRVERSGKASLLGYASDQPRPGAGFKSHDLFTAASPPFDSTGLSNAGAIPGIVSSGLDYIPEVSNNGQHVGVFYTRENVTGAEQRRAQNYEKRKVMQYSKGRKLLGVAPGHCGTGAAKKGG